MENEYDELLWLLKHCPIPEKELMYNLGLFIPRRKLAHILYIHEIYEHILEVPGCIMEFGTWWGQNMSLFKQLIGIYEPLNQYRKVIGFDTFEGFPAVSSEDCHNVAVGGYGVTKDYESYLRKVISAHTKQGVVDENCEVRKGDAPEKLETYLCDHRETIIALAYFDMDLYGPTKKCLESVRPFLVKGSVVAFDEVDHASWPGETIALREVFGLGNVKLHRSKLSFSSPKAYMVME